MSSKEKNPQYPKDPDLYTYMASGALLNILNRERATLTGSTNKGKVTSVKILPKEEKTLQKPSI